MRPVVGGEVAAHLAGPLGPVLDRVVGDSGRLAAQVGQFPGRGLDAGRGVQHGAARDVLLQPELEGTGDVVHVHVVAGRRPVAVDDQRHAGVERLEEDIEHAALASAPGPVHIAEPDGDGTDPVGLGEGVRVPLAGQLARPVRGDRLGQRLLVDGRRGVSDQRPAGRGQHHPLDARPPRGVQHAERAERVDLEVHHRILDRADHRAGRGEMDGRPEALERVVQCGRVADVALDQFGVDSGEVRGIPGAEVVEHPDPVTARYQPPDQRRAHEAGAAGHQDSVRSIHKSGSVLAPAHRPQAGFC